MVTTTKRAGDNPIRQNYPTTPAITVNSNEVCWLFGVEHKLLAQWVRAGTLTPCGSTANGNLFWRKDVAALLATFGA